MGTVLDDVKRRAQRLPLAELVWLAFILAAILPWKLSYSLHIFTDLGIDGGYYTNIAQNVRDGNGLVTNVSLYHYGFRTFPHPTTIYPLWPFLYGLTGRAFEITEVAIWLPTCLYVLSLLFCFAWARRVFPEPLFPRVAPGLHAGHVALLMLGLHVQYFEFTSRPYTEGLSFALLFLALFRMHVLWQRWTVRAGLEIGAWLGVLLLARSQFVVPAIAAGMTMGAMMLLPERRGGVLRMALACAGGFVVVYAPYALYVASLKGGISPSDLLLFGKTPDDSPLSQKRTLVETDGLWDYIKDRAGGVGAAFDWKGRYGYRQSFHTFGYALLLAIPFALVALVRLLRARGVELRAWLRHPRAPEAIFLGLIAIGGFALLHHLHKAYFGDWVFHRRHGLAAMPLFFFALVFLLRARIAPAAVLGVLVLVSGVYEGHGVMRAKTAKQEKKKPRSPETPLVRWLNKERERLGDLTVIITEQRGQTLSWRTQGVNYHWAYDGTTQRDVDIMFDELGADYLIMGRKTSSYKMRRPKARFEERYEQVKRISGVEIFKPRATDAAAENTDDEVEPQEAGD